MGIPIPIGCPSLLEVPKPNSATFGMARANGRICDPLRFAAAMLLPLAVRNDSDFQELGLAKIGILQF